MVIRSSVDNILIATNGTNGQPGAPGTSSYIHIKYSDDGGQTFTSNSGETIGAYIGIYRDTTRADSSNVADYQWKKIEGEDGAPAYTVMLSNENFSISTDTGYMPIHTQSFTCNVTVLKGSSPTDFTITASTDTENDIVTRVSGHTVNITVAPAEALTATQGVITLSITTADGQTFTKDITWSTAIQGRDGQPGSTGVSITGVTNYYLATLADSGVTKETAGWTTTVQSITEHDPYLWNYEVVTGSNGQTISSTDPVIIGRYGRDGDAAAEGRGIYSITEHYQTSSSNTTPPSTWSNTPVATDNEKRYLWNYETITYTDNTSEDTQKRVIGTHGTPGTNGTSITVSSTTIDYAISASGTQAPTNETEWGELKTATEDKPYLWTRTNVVFSDNTTMVSYSVSRQGIDGTNGTDGKPGANGKDGTSTYVHIKYSAVANPTNADLLETPSEYIGICHDSNVADPTTASSYTWSKWQGKDGENGQPGAKGEDGTNSYIHFAYSSSADGSENFSVTSFDGATYIGIRVDDVLEDSIDHRHYEWSLIKGEDGTSVQIISTSIQYAIGANGTTTPAASEWGNSIPATTSEKQYLWTKTVVNYSNNSSTTSYSVARQGIDGTNGQDGKPGTNGKDGTSTYVHIKYSAVKNPTDSDITETPSDYIGICHDSNVDDPTTASSYTWSKWLGEDGKNGTPGKDGTNGTSSYTHFAYANSADGSEDFSVTSFAGAKYLGVRVDEVKADSTNYQDYTWNLIKGADGDSITVVSTEYKEGTSSTIAPSGTWSTSPVSVSEGNYLWTRITYSDGKTSYSIAKQGTSGTSVTVTKTEYAYKLSTSGTTVPTGTWETTPQAPTTTQYAWTRTTTTFSDGSTAVIYTVGGKVGQTGSAGDPGRGIVSITEYFLLSNTDDASKITFPEVNNKHGWTTVGEALIWSKTKPYLWHCTEVVYENPSSTVYIDKYCDTGWKAADLVQANLTDFQQGVDNVIDRDNQSIRSAVWENTYTYKPKTDAQGNYMYDDNGKIIPDKDNTRTMSQYMAEQIVDMDGITSRVSSTESNVNSIDGRLSTAESTITQHASDIEAKVSKDGVIAAINLSAETDGSGGTAKISADKVEINGTAIFNSISNDVNSAIEGKGYATTSQAQGYANAAQQAAIAQIPTDISELNNDAGYQTANDVSGSIVSITTLYYASNSTTAPAKPTSHITTNSTGTRGAWNISLPSYNVNYPYLYVCNEIKTKGETYYWTSVEQMAYASAISGIKTTADAAAPKSDAIARSQRIYYRKTTSGAPAKNTTWLATSGSGYNNWSLNIPKLTDSNGTKYLYLYTAVQTQTVAQQAAGTACTCSDVLIDDTATIIDGGTIITGTVTAREITADNLEGDHGWINLKDGKFYYGDKTTFDSASNAISWNGSKLQIKADEFLLSSGNSILDEIEAIETWFYPTAPTTSNEPASLWTTDNLKKMHLRDIYFDINSGKSYRWAIDGTTYKWVEIEDKELSALAGRVATAETNISSNSEQIGLMATKTEVANTYATKDSVPTSVTDLSDADNYATKTYADGAASTAEANAKSDTTTKLQLYYTKTETDSAITQSAEGITSRVTKLETRSVGNYATSSTAVGTAAKTATIIPDVTGWELYKGAVITVKFTVANTTSAPTLNVNGTGAKAIKTYSGGALSEAEYKWDAGATMSFVYDGTNWRVLDSTELTRLKNAETSISQNAEAITLRATKEEVTNAVDAAKAEIKVTTDGITSEVNKKVGNSEIISKINQSAESVKIQASKVEIDGTTIFNELEIGGRNLLRHTKDFKDATYSSTCTFATDSEGITIVTLPAYTGTLTWYAFAFHPNIPYTLVRNKTVTLSFWYRSASWTLASGGHNYPLPSFEILETETANPSGSDRLKYRTIYDATVPAPTTEWQQFVRTYNVTDEFFTSGSGTVTEDKYFTIQLFQHNLSQLQCKKFKLEIGNKATDWTPAPEDLESYADTAAATAKADVLETIGTGLGIKWNASTFDGTWNPGEAYFCKYDSATDTYTDANGWVMFNGVKRTVAKGMQINPNTIIPYNTRTYKVLRLSSASATTGTQYYVWYDGGWKSTTPATPTTDNIATWTWNVNTDIVLCSYVEMGSEVALVDYEQYTPVRTAHQVTVGNTAYQYAAPRTMAVAKTQRIYYRSNSSTKPTAYPTGWVTVETDKWNSNATTASGWSRKVTPISNGTGASATKYLYLWTATQKQMTDGTVATLTADDIALDDSTTVIDGGNIITGSVAANQLAANSVTAEKVAAHSISTNHLLISDNTNLAQANENIPNSLPGRVWNGTGYVEDGTSFAAGYKLSIEDGYLVKRTATQQYLMFTDFTPSSFRTGDELYYEFTAKAESATTIGFVCWGYTSPYTGSTCSNYTGTLNLTTEEQTFSGTIKLANEKWDDTVKYYLLGINNNATTKVQIYVRKVIIRKKSAGELIVDGSITAKKIQGNSLSIGVFDSDTQDAVLNSTIQIGGRNLLYDTNAPSLVTTGIGGGTRYFSNVATLATNGDGTEWTVLPDSPVSGVKYGAKHVCTQTGGNVHCLSFYTGADRVDFVPGEQYTVSFWVKSEVVGAVVRIALTSNDHWSRTGAYLYTVQNINDWEQVSVTFTYFGSESLTDCNQQETILYIGYDYNVVGTVWCCGYQVELGNMVTNWSEYAYTQTSYGGRNLIRNTNIIDVAHYRTRPNINGYYNDGEHYGNIEYYGGTLSGVEHGVKLTATGGAGYGLRFGTGTTDGTLIQKADGLYGLEAGETYTLSFDAACKISSTYTNTAFQYLGVYLYGDIKGDGTLGNDNTWNVEWYSYPIQFYPSDNGEEKEGRISFTFTIPKDATRLCLSIRPKDNNADNAAAGDYIEMRNIKLEKGNHATDWSPAPEDIGEQFNDVSDRIDVLDEFQTGARGWMEFSDGELTIGKQVETSDDIFTTVIDGTRMAFKQNEDVVAYISNKELSITDANIKNNLKIGKFSFQPHDSGDGGMSLIWN